MTDASAIQIIRSAIKICLVNIFLSDGGAPKRRGAW